MVGLDGGQGPEAAEADDPAQHGRCRCQSDKDGDEVRFDRKPPVRGLAVESAYPRRSISLANRRCAFAVADLLDDGVRKDQVEGAIGIGEPRPISKHEFPLAAVRDAWRPVDVQNRDARRRIEQLPGDMRRPRRRARAPLDWT